MALDFDRKLVDRFLETVKGHPVIVGIGDQVMPGNLIERIAYIAQRIKAG